MKVDRVYTAAKRARFDAPFKNAFQRCDNR
jgi:hypothetical protein